MVKNKHFQPVTLREFGFFSKHLWAYIVYKGYDSYIDMKGKIWKFFFSKSSQFSDSVTHLASIKYVNDNKAM